jgi:hypothetical protein
VILGTPGEKDRHLFNLDYFLPKLLESCSMGRAGLVKLCGTYFLQEDASMETGEVSH